MKLSSHWRESWRNLTASKLRSFLALLGILVGTASVVALVSSSELATNHALAQFKTLGTNLLSLTISPPSDSKSKQTNKFSVEEADNLKANIPQILEVAPYTTSYNSTSYRGTQLYGSILGVTQSFSDVAKISLAQGRFVSDLDRTSLYCVIGSSIAKKIQQTSGQGAIGQLISSGRQVYTVVGTLQKWPQNLFLYADINNSILIPIKLSMILSKSVQINNVLFRLSKHADINTTQQAIQNQLAKLLPGDHFYFRNPKQIITLMRKQHSTFTLLLGMIGGIALVVGGIGVMNIMLVSVVERKREIGIRLAIGAKRRDIRYMFLIEGVTLTILGGIIGIAIGTLITVILALSSGWGYQFFFLPASLGFAVSVLVGIISTIYPSYRASKLDPVTCLQSD